MTGDDIPNTPHAENNTDSTPAGFDAMDVVRPEIAAPGLASTADEVQERSADPLTKQLQERDRRGIILPARSPVGGIIVPQ